MPNFLLGTNIKFLLLSTYTNHTQRIARVSNTVFQYPITLIGSYTTIHSPEDRFYRMVDWLLQQKSAGMSAFIEMDGFRQV